MPPAETTEHSIWANVARGSPLRLTLMVAAVAAGVWSGETETDFLLDRVGLVLAVASLMAGVAIGRRVRSRVLLGLLTLSLFGTGVVVGSRNLGRVYNNCFHDGVNAQDDLAQYLATHGAYPSNLSVLPGSPYCARLLRGPLLEYTSTGSTYELSFQDWLVSQEANDKQRGFSGRK
jgi:hypothetical protein